jgi:hypothetical protein
MNRVGVWSAPGAVVRSAVRRSAVVAVCGLLLVGCSTPAANNTGPDTGHAADTISMSTAPPSGPALPAAAKATTNAGAEAFVNHWFASYNHALANLNSDELTPISDPACVFCQRAKSTIENLKTNHRTVSGGETTIANVKLIRGNSGPAGMRLDCTYDQKASSILDGTGAKITNGAAKKTGHMLVAIKWTGKQWTMLDIAVLD